LALQFSLSNPDIATTLVGIATPEQVETNLRWISQLPDPTLLTEVQAILAPVQNKSWISGRSEHNGEPDFI
jgi:L-galactose dehydrogenase